MRYCTYSLLDIEEYVGIHHEVIIFIKFLKNRGSDENVRTVLGRLCCLYGVTKMLEKPNGYIEGGFFTGSEFMIVMEAKELLLALLKPDLVTLMDVYNRKIH